MPIQAPFSYFQRGANVLDVIQDFGSVADGVTDDWAALSTAYAFSAKYGIPVWHPTINAAGNPAVYGVGKELMITSGSRLIGDAISSSMGPVLRALSSSMRAVMVLRTTDAGFTSSASMKPAYVEGLSFDANNLAAQAMLVEGVFFGSFRYCNFFGGVRNAVRLPHHGVTQTIGAVTSNRPGGSPAVRTVAFSDPNYTAFTAQDTTILLKVASNGGLNAATYVASFDGGVSYATAAQVIAPISNVCVTSSTTYLYDSGIQVTFGAGSYVTGDIIAQFTVTLNDESSPGNHNAINADCVFDHCEFRASGQVQGNAGAIGAYGGFGTTVTVPGTVSTTFLSQVVTGSGTSFLTGTPVPSRNGDMMWIRGLGNLPIACVLDDTHVALPQGVLPTTVSGQDWAMSAGAGYWEDDNVEDTRIALDYCRSSFVPVCARHAGANGGGLVGHRMRCELYGFCAVIVGGTIFALPRFLWSYLHIEAGSGNSNTIFLMPRCNGGTFLEPCELFPTGASAGTFPDYGAGSAMVIKGGQITYFGGLGSIIAGTTATSANAGAASALPATPQEYITVLNAAGQARKVPLYLP